MRYSLGMIIIWDNEQAYSDHALYFVDIGDVAIDLAESMMQKRLGYGSLMGVADKIEWRADGATSTLIEFVEPHFDFDEIVDVPLDVRIQIAKRRVERLQDSLDQNLWMDSDRLREELRKAQAIVAALTGAATCTP